MYIIALSVINGISGGLLIILFPNAAIELVSGNLNIIYFAVLPASVAMLLISKHLVQLRVNCVVNEAVEKMILENANTVRHDELPAFEQRNRSDIRMSIANAPSIADAATRNIETFQCYISLIVGWLYILLFISWWFGVTILFLRLLSVMLSEMFEKIVKSLSLDQMKEQTGLFKVFHNHLFGFKEMKFNAAKDNDLFENFLLPRIERNRETGVRKMRYSAELTKVNLLFFFLTNLICVSFFSAYLSQDNIFRIIKYLSKSFAPYFFIQPSLICSLVPGCRQSWEVSPPWSILGGYLTRIF
ncbi:MAG: hypothetical protein GY749_05530 [Desulfobacteraceae bacterium]|nr:hypothetical protein [Desulfobacteraceae bacterium]